MSETSLATALRNGIAWNTINAIFSQSAGFVIFLVLARMLEPAVFGAVALSAVIADFIANDGRYAGMDAILQRGDFDKKSLNAAFISLSLVASPFALFLVMAGPLIAGFENAPLVGYYMPIFGLLLLFTPWLSVMDALIMRELGFKTFAKRNMISTLAGGIAGITLAFSPLAIWALPAQRIVSTMAVVVFEFRHTGWLPGRHTKKGACREILRRFLPLWMVAAINISMQRAAVLFFGIRFDGATVGLFRAADRISESLQNPLVSPLFALWFPLMSKVRGNLAAEREVFTAIIRTAAFVTLPAFTGLIVVADDAVALLLPSSYAGVAPILRAVAITSLMIPIVWFNPIAMNALGLNRMSLQYSIIVALTCIGALVVIPTSTPGAAILVMSSPALVYGVIGNVLLLRRLNLQAKVHYMGLAPAAAAALAMGVVVYYVQATAMVGMQSSFRLAISASLGMVIYFGWLTCFSRSWMIERIQLLRGQDR
ncbi:oligosaccharide flippase family protein (plasmid) [Rhizobium sp. CC1099]|nr:oligosaccharide flippase family protein [Rhizobium sp. CC1099]WFU89830.1 oligosaccharide flippase family protein [Rhizobium sp. CC1099]